MRRMTPLKLFRSTGYASSLLVPGETRVAMHPGWMVLAVGLWAGLACNVALWRAAVGTGEDGMGLVQALLLGTFAGAACAAVNSILGWRKTLKPAATVLVAMGALLACGISSQALPVDLGLFDRPLSSLLLSPWASLLHWQVPTLFTVLGVLPVIWIWTRDVRRLSGPHQLRVNLAGMALATCVLAASGYLLRTVPS
jgi:glucan phosphoethanolaminetransferase (alkaline phosphatase superfamily)